jgi:hypothetical protein
MSVCESRTHSHCQQEKGLRDPRITQPAAKQSESTKPFTKIHHSYSRRPEVQHKDNDGGEWGEANERSEGK